jgi:hypothetical protein
MAIGGPSGRRPAADEVTSMTTQADYTPDDWETLRLAPAMAAGAMRLAGRTGAIGRILEDRAEKTATRAALERLGSVVLIAGLAAAGIDEAPAPADADAAAGAEAYIAGTIAEAQRARAVLAATASPDEAEAYGTLVLDIAEAVARAAREKGSERNVSEPEQKLLARLAAALGVDGYEPPHPTDSPFGDYRDVGKAEQELYGEDPTR